MRVVVWMCAVVFAGAAARADSSAPWSWSFDEGRGDVVHDADRQPGGEILGEHRWISGHERRALELNGITGCVRLQGDGYFEIPGDEGLTVETTVRVVKSGSTQMIIFASPTLELEIRGESGVVSFNLGNTAGNARCLGRTEITDGRWHDIAAVRDPKTRTLRLYVDGYLDGEAQDTTAGAVLAIPRAAFLGGKPNEQEMLGGAIDRIQMIRGAKTVKPRPIEEIDGKTRNWTLANDRVEMRFTAHGSALTLEQLTDRATGTTFIEDAEGMPINLWQVALRSPRWSAILDESQGDLTVDEAEGRLVFKWTNLPLGDDRAAVTMAVDLPADAAMSNWSIDVEHDSKEFGVWTAQCPRILNLKKLADDPDQNFVAIPGGNGGGAGEGQLFENPWQTLHPIIRTYPCYYQSMQFNAWYGPDAGLYLATHDGAMHLKGFFINTSTTRGGKPVLTYTLIHYPADSGVEGTQFHQAYPAVVGVFHGDWYDAARIYRTWAIDQVWCRLGPNHQRTDVSPWLMAGAWWTVFSMDRTDDGREHLRRKARELPWDEMRRQARHLDIEANLARVERAYDYFGYPMILWCNEWWDGGGDISPPRYVPMNNLEEFLAQLKHRVPAAHLSGHMQAKRFSVQIPEYTDEVVRSLEHTPDGVDAIEPLDAMDKGDQIAYPCWATVFWQKDWEKRAARIASHGLDGFHMDELGSHTDFTFQCFNREHGHPVGGGTLYADTRRHMADLIRQSARTRNPDFALHHEALCEIYIDVADAAEVDTSPNNRNIPLFEAVYHDYYFVMGRRIMEWFDRNMFPMGARDGDELFDEFASSYAQTYIWGNQPSWTRIDIVDYAPRVAAFIKKTMDARYRAMPYLNFGDMMRPLKVTAPLEKVKRIWRVNDTPEHTLAVVMNSVWKAEDGTIGIVLFNITDRPQKISYELDLAECGMEDGQFRITRIDGPRPIEMGETEAGVLRRTDEVEPYHAMILKVEPF